MRVAGRALAACLLAAVPSGLSCAHAESANSAALEIARVVEPSGPATGIDRSRVLEQLGRILDREGRGHEADEAFRNALRELTPAGVGASDSANQTIAHALSQDLRDMSDFAGAEAADRIAIEAEQVGNSTPDAASVELLASLGADLQWQHRYAEAADAFSRAVESGEQAFGSTSAVLASPLEQLGNALAASGDMTKAALAFERAAAIEEAAPRPDGPPLERLGNALYSFGACALAARAHAAAFDVKADADDATAAGLLNKLGLDLYWDDRVTEAADAHRRALALREAAFGQDHPLTTDVLLNLIYDLSDSGSGPQALEFARRAVDAAESAEDPWSSAIAAADAALGHVLRRAGRSAEAVSPLRDALAICDHSCASEPMLRARVLVEAAAALAALGRNRDAEALLRDATLVLDHEVDRLDPAAAGLRRIASSP